MSLSLAQRLAVTEFLAKHFATVRKSELNPEAAAELEVGERRAAKFGGRRAAWVSMPAPAVRATVKNEAALLAWARKYLPDEIETVERVRPSSARMLGELMKAHGGWADEDGVLIPVDGIEVSASDPSPRVELAEDAAALIAAAWQQGEIDLGEMLALPGAAPEADIPLPGPHWPEEPATDAAMPFGVFGDELGLLDPVRAAMYAIAMSGGKGFTTPPVEAYRMLRDGGVHEVRARAWMAAHGLDPDDPREGQDTPWPLPEGGEPGE